MSKITNDGLTRSGTVCFIYSCTHMATVGVKWLIQWRWQWEREIMCTSGYRWDHKQMNQCRSVTLPQQRHRPGVTGERANVLFDPVQSGDNVQQCIVAGRVAVSSAQETCSRVNHCRPACIIDVNYTTTDRHASQQPSATTRTLVAHQRPLRQPRPFICSTFVTQ